MPRKQSRTVREDLYDQPGHLLRRAHQIAVSLFGQEVGPEVTPREYAILRMVYEKPGIDQVGLARLIGVDTSSAALTAARLAQRGLLTRAVSEQDRRLLQLELTDAGRALLATTVDGVHRMRDRILSPLDAQEQALFMDLLRKLVLVHNEDSRAPLWIRPPDTKD
jgi:MarR family transcriptional regulator, temperature-dependent positive regulator of motility